MIKLSKHADTLQLISQRTLFNVPARVILPDSRRVRIFCPIAKRYTAKSAYNRTISLGIYYESQIRAVYQARARRERTSVSVSRHLSLGTECVDAFRIGRESRIPVCLFRVDREKCIYLTRAREFPISHLCSNGNRNIRTILRIKSLIDERIKRLSMPINLSRYLF